MAIGIKGTLHHEKERPVLKFEQVNWPLSCLPVPKEAQTRIIVSLVIRGVCSHSDVTSGTEGCSSIPVRRE